MIKWKKGNRKSPRDAYHSAADVGSRRAKARGKGRCHIEKGRAMPPIHVMIKPASGLCNMRCSYCFYADEMRNRSRTDYGIMTAETLENIVKRVLDFAEGSCTIAFQGGEPTLAGLDFYRNLLELEAKYNVRNIPISHALQTNGYVLDQEWCSFFARNRFLIGLSVDGIKATHDACRKDALGQDTYFHVLKAAEMLRAAGAEFNVLTVVNARTAPKIRKIYQQYRKLGFHWQQYIACLDPLGETGVRREYSLTPEAYGRFLIDLFELWHLDLQKGEQPYIRQFENYVGILLGQPPESCEQRGVCSLQTIVEADGSVYPCDFYCLDEYCLGNFNRDDFDTILVRLKEKGFLEASANHTDDCRKCAYHAVCRGGCRRHREHEDLPGIPSGQNYFCRSYKMFLDACLPGLKDIAGRIRMGR